MNDSLVCPWENGGDPSLDTELLAGTGELPGQFFPPVAERPTDAAEQDSSGEDVREVSRRIIRMPYIKLYSTGNTHGDVVLTTAHNRFGWKKVQNLADAHICWFDKGETFENLHNYNFRKHQKVNLYPGMKELCQKAIFARHLNRMQELFPDDFDFFPTTYVLPYDNTKLQTALSSNSTRDKFYIVKPSASCGGDGIYLTKDMKHIELNSEDIIQEYIPNALTLEGYKFDFRIYVLLLSISPLHVYVHREGLARLATEKYRPPTTANCKNTWMHLTNYSLNKFNTNFQNTEAEDTGSKRSITSVMQVLQEEGHDVEEIWYDIEGIIAKTLISLQPSLMVMYDSLFLAPSDAPTSTATATGTCGATTSGSTSSSSIRYNCFQILGFDIMLDQHLIPWLIELNNHPSLQTPDPIDERIKRQVITPMLHMVAYDMKKNRKKRVKSGGGGSSSCTTTTTHHATSSMAAAASLANAKQEIGMLTDVQKRLLFETKYCDNYKLILPSDNNCMPDYSHLHIFNEKIREAFSLSCGVKSKHSMTSSRFRKFATECGIVRNAQNNHTKYFSTPELDIVFMKHTKNAATPGHLGFFEFCEMILHTIAPRLMPVEEPAPTSLQMFVSFVNNFIDV